MSLPTSAATQPGTFNTGWLGFLRRAQDFLHRPYAVIPIVVAGMLVITLGVLLWSVDAFVTSRQQIVFTQSAELLAEAFPARLREHEDFVARFSNRVYDGDVTPETFSENVRPLFSQAPEISSVRLIAPHYAVDAIASAEGRTSSVGDRIVNGTKALLEEVKANKEPRFSHIHENPVNNQRTFSFFAPYVRDENVSFIIGVEYDAAVILDEILPHDSEYVLSFLAGSSDQDMNSRVREVMPDAVDERFLTTIPLWLHGQDFHLVLMKHYTGWNPTVIFAIIAVALLLLVIVRSLITSRHTIDQLSRFRDILPHTERFLSTQRDDLDYFLAYMRAHATIESLEKYEGFFDNFPQAFIIIQVEEDGTYTIAAVNKRLEQETGFERKDIVGKTLDTLLPSSLYTFFIQKFSETQVARKPIYFERTIQSSVPDATEVVKTNLIPIFNEQAECTHFIGLSITELSSQHAQRVKQENAVALPLPS